jgi:hypothetical protein
MEDMPMLLLLLLQVVVMEVLPALVLVISLVLLLVVVQLVVDFSMTSAASSPLVVVGGVGFFSVWVVVPGLLLLFFSLCFSTLLSVLAPVPKMPSRFPTAFYAVLQGLGVAVGLLTVVFAITTLPFCQRMLLIVWFLGGLLPPVVLAWGLLSPHRLASLYEIFSFAFGMPYHILLHRLCPHLHLILR